MAVIIGSWFPTHHHGQMWGFISTSSRASSLGSTLLLAGLLYFVSWRWLHFLAAGITVCIILSLTKFFFPRNTGTTPEINLDPPTADLDADHPLRDQSRRVPTRAISQKAASAPRSTPLARSVIKFMKSRRGSSRPRDTSQILNQKTNRWVPCHALVSAWTSIQRSFMTQSENGG
jgi:MFS family permease